MSLSSPHCQERAATPAAPPPNPPPTSPHTLSASPLPGRVCVRARTHERACMSHARSPGFGGTPLPSTSETRIAVAFGPSSWLLLQRTSVPPFPTACPVDFQLGSQIGPAFHEQLQNGQILVVAFLLLKFLSCSLDRAEDLFVCLPFSPSPLFKITSWFLSIFQK